MDYKKETVEILQKINDDSLLEFFYRFIDRVLRNRGYWYGLQKENHRDVRESRSRPNVYNFQICM